MILTINNSYSKISGLTAAQHKELANQLSYVVGGKSAYFSKYGVQRRSLLSKRGEFPSGLLPRIMRMGWKWDKLIDQRIKPTYRLGIKSTWAQTPYEDQVKAVEAALFAERAILSLPTGTGKSLVIAMIANELRVKTLIVVPSLEIKRQLTETISNIFNDTSWITIENIDSSALQKAKKYDCLIIDETHRVAAKTYQKLNKNMWNNIYYRFFLSATAFRNDPEEQLLFESIAGEVKFTLSYNQAVSRGYIVPVEAYFVEIDKQPTEAFTYPQVYSQLVVNNTNRNTAISILLKTLESSNIPTLCLVKEVKHGHILANQTGIQFTNGEDEESRDYITLFNRDEIKSLIGTTGILGEGLDTKPAEYIIIAGLGKAKSQFLQQVGRGVRKYPGKESCKVIIFKDKSHKYLLRHFKEQCKILKEYYGIEPVKLEI